MPDNSIFETSTLPDPPKLCEAVIKNRSTNVNDDITTQRRGRFFDDCHVFGIISAWLAWLPSRHPWPPRYSIKKRAILKRSDGKNCFLMLQPHPPGLRSVSQPRTARLKKALNGSWACGLSPMHPANRFTFHGRRKAPRTAALRFGRALFAAVSTKNRAPRLTELGKTGFHSLPRLHLTQYPLHHVRNKPLGVL